MELWIGVAVIVAVVALGAVTLVRGRWDSWRGLDRAYGEGARAHDVGRAQSSDDRMG